MFERFTNRARRVVVLAQEQARQLNHNYIGTEHLLLGLAKEDDGIAGQVIAAFDMDYDHIRDDVIAKVGIGKREPQGGHIPFTPRAKKTLELSLREALQLGHNYIGTEHILLGLLREGEGVAFQILTSHSDVKSLRAAVIDAVPPGNPELSRGSILPSTRGAVLRLRERLGGRRESSEASEHAADATPAATATLNEATRLAGAAPVGSHHLLLAALADADSAAARVLASLGVNLDQAKEALRSADVTGTSDEPPEEAGRRQMAIQVSDGLVTVVIADPVLVAAAREALAAVNAGTAGQPGATGESGESGEAGESSDSGEAGGKRGKGAGGSATATVIRGEHPAAASLADVWRELLAALEKIKNAANPPAAA